MTRARDLADGADKDIAGTLTLDDIVLSNDMSVADNGKVQLGAGNDLQIYHDAGHSRIVDAGTGNLRIQADDLRLQSADGVNNYITADNGGAATLYHNALAKLATTSTGIDVTGNATFGDNGKAIFGTTSDGLQIYNESSGDKRIVESGNGNLKIQGDNLYLQNSAGTENHIIALTDSSVSLMFNNESRLATVSGGVEVTGYIDPDYKRPNSPGAQTSNNNGHWWKLGTVSGFYGSQSLEITLYGTQSYSSSSNIAGKTTLLARANNAVSTIEATFWSETMGNDGIQSAAWINTANNQFDIYVQVGTFFGLESTVVTSAIWTPNLSNTGSNSQPASSVVFERLYYFQLGVGDKRLVHGSSETVINESGLNKDFRVESDSNTHMLFVDGGNNRVGLGTASPAQPLHFKGSAVQFENTQNSYLQIYTSDTHLYTAAAHPLRFGTNSTERMRIDNAGRVTMPYQPSFRVQGTGGWTTFSNGAYTTVNFVGVHHNIGNHFNTSTNIFTAPVAGRYIFTLSIYARLQGGQGDNTNYWFTGFLKNGSAVNNTAIVGYVNDGDYDFGYTQTEIFNMAANDTMLVFARAGGSYNGEYYGQNCFFGGHLLG